MSDESDPEFTSAIQQESDRPFVSLHELADAWEALDESGNDDDHPGSASAFADELRTVLRRGYFLISRRDIKTQYGVQIWWTDPKGAGVPEGQRDFPRIDWFDDPEGADSFALSYHKPINLKDGVFTYADPPEVKTHVAKVLRYTRKAIEIYSMPEEVPGA